MRFSGGFVAFESWREDERNGCRKRGGQAISTGKVRVGHGVEPVSDLWTKQFCHGFTHKDAPRDRLLTVQLVSPIESEVKKPVFDFVLDNGNEVYVFARCCL